MKVKTNEMWTEEVLRELPIALGIPSKYLFNRNKTLSERLFQDIVIKLNLEN